MKAKSINWKKHESGCMQGLIDTQELFTVKSAKKSNTFELISFPYVSDTFHKSIYSKPLGIFSTEESAMKLAEQKWDEFVLSLCDTDKKQEIAIPNVPEEERERFK